MIHLFEVSRRLRPTAVSGRVRNAAEKALESIKNIDKNQKAWRDWYAGLKKKGK